MNPSLWPVVAVLCAVAYLFWVLTIDFRLARIDDDVVAPDVDAHNDPEIWTREAWLVRVAKRKKAALVRWVVVSCVMVAGSLALRGGGQMVHALAQPTATQDLHGDYTKTPAGTATITGTPGPSRTPASTRTPGLTLTQTPRVILTQGTSTPTPTVTPSFTPFVIYRPGQQVEVTRVVRVELLVTRVVYQTSPPRLITQTPNPTYTAFPTYTPYPTYTPFPTETPCCQDVTTPTETPSLTPEPSPTVASYP
jgi:hypothetical protein